MERVAENYAISLFLSCKLLSISHSAYYYKPTKRPEDEVIKKELRMLAEAHPRWGFDKMINKIKQTRTGWKHKRVYRNYTEIGLNLRVKPKKRLPSREAKSILQPIYPNHCWSIDFMSDALRCGKRFRTLNIIDDYNREALLIVPSHSLPAYRVTDYLDQLALVKGYPSFLRTDNGPEFISGHFQEWAALHGIEIQFIQPGKPAQNALIERFNRTYREDILDSYLFDSLNEVEQITRQWLILYNQDRPHQSLGNLSPIQFALSRKEGQQQNTQHF